MRSATALGAFPYVDKPGFVVQIRPLLSKNAPLYNDNTADVPTSNLTVFKSFPGDVYERVLRV